MTGNDDRRADVYILRIVHISRLMAQRSGADNMLDCVREVRLRWSHTAARGQLCVCLRRNHAPRDIGDSA